MNQFGRLRYIYFLLEHQQWEEAQDLLSQMQLPDDIESPKAAWIAAFAGLGEIQLQKNNLEQAASALIKKLNTVLDEDSLEEHDEGRTYVALYQIKHLQELIQESHAHPTDRKKALFALKLWPNTQQFEGYRAWGVMPGHTAHHEFLPHRFWGLYNIRTQADKPVWLSWDAWDQKLVVVKELRPGLMDPDKSNRINWESEIFNDFRDLQDRRVQGVVPLIANGKNWFAAAHAQMGSLQWCFFAPPPKDEPGNDQLFHFIYPENPFETPITSRNWKKVRNYFVKSAKTLHNFHLQGIVHRDIHSDNLLVNHLEDEKDMEAWICDFDRARNYQDIFLPRHLNVPAEGVYIPPERLEKPVPNSSPLRLSAYYGLPEGDVYSLAAVLCDVILQKQHENAQDRYNALQKSRLIPSSLRQLLLEALHTEPRNRPNMGIFAERLEKISWQTNLSEVQIPLAVAGLMLILMVIMYFIIYERPSIASDCSPYTCLSGELKGDDLQLERDKIYLLKGMVFVKTGVLNIESGTKILADSAATLIIGRNAQIHAVGNPEQPIVFSSIKPKPKAGDWGGIVVLGKAPVQGKNYLEFCTYSQMENQPELCYFGGNDPDHSSGKLQFIRIEYAGDVLVENQETNGMTLAGVGRGTVIDHILVSHVNDDCFEFFGGTFSAQYLVCIDAEDDGFDWESGYDGMLRNLLYIAGKHQYRSFDEKGRFALEGGDASEKRKASTGPEISNLTVYLERTDSVNLLPKVASWSNDTRPFIHNLLALGYPQELCQRPKYSQVKSWLFYPKENPALREQFQNAFVPKSRIVSNDLSRSIAPYYGAFRDSTANWLKGKWGKIK